MNIGRNKILLAVSAGIVATAGIAASANTLSGLTDPTNDLGTNTAVVNGCSGTILIKSWGTFTFTPSPATVKTGSAVLQLTDGGARPCLGQAAEVRLLDSSEAQLGTTGSIGALANGANAVTFATPADTKLVTKVIVTVSG